MGAFVAPRPQLLVVSSAGVERNAIVGESSQHLPWPSPAPATGMGARAVLRPCPPFPRTCGPVHVLLPVDPPPADPRPPLNPNPPTGDDVEARKRDIPIVQLNPGGVLNWKYEGECAARAAGFPYAVVRCTGARRRPPPAGRAATGA